MQLDSEIWRNAFETAKKSGTRVHVAEVLSTTEKFLHGYVTWRDTLIWLRDAKRFDVLLQQYANWENTLRLCESEIAALDHLVAEIREYIATDGDSP
jgi:hypothetical protein